MVVAAWGLALARVGPAARRSAWRGVAPGHDERAGTQRAGQTRQGHRALRAGLTPWAHAAARPKGTSLSALEHRVAARRGQKRAMLAVAPAMVVSACHLRSRNAPDRAWGAHDGDAHRRHQRVDHVARRLARLGDRVRLHPVPAASRLIFSIVESNDHGYFRVSINVGIGPISQETFNPSREGECSSEVGPAAHKRGAPCSAAVMG
jgi:transposase